MLPSIFSALGASSTRWLHQQEKKSIFTDRTSLHLERVSYIFSIYMANGD